MHVDTNDSWLFIHIYENYFGKRQEDDPWNFQQYSPMLFVLCDTHICLRNTEQFGPDILITE